MNVATTLSRGVTGIIVPPTEANQRCGDSLPKKLLILGERDYSCLDLTTR